MSYSGNLLMENRNGLIVDSRVWEATGTAERYAALDMLQNLPGDGRGTVGGDKGFDTAEFVRECRNLHVTPHVAQNLERRGGSAIDGRTTWPAGYRISQKKRKRIEECFAWLKTIALPARPRTWWACEISWAVPFNLCEPKKTWKRVGFQCRCSIASRRHLSLAMPMFVFLFLRFILIVVMLILVAVIFLIGDTRRS